MDQNKGLLLFSESHTFSFYLKFHAMDCDGYISKRVKVQGVVL